LIMFRYLNGLRVADINMLNMYFVPTTLRVELNQRDQFKS